MAKRRSKAVLSAVASLVVLSVVALMIVLAASTRQFVALSQAREEAQLRNALSLKINHLRSDLTSVTFWDDAVANTAVQFNEAWVTQNIGEWLAAFYQVDEAYVLDGRNRLAFASVAGHPTTARAYQRWRGHVEPMVRTVRTRSRNYMPGKVLAASGTAEDNLARNLDTAELVWAGGSPSIVIVAPILSDFGKTQVPAGHHYLLVAVHHINPKFLAQLSSGLLLNDLRIEPAHSLNASSATEIPLGYGGKRPIGWVRWQPERNLQGLLGQLLPFALAALVAFTAAALLVIRFVRRSEQELTLTRYDADHDELTGLSNRRLLTRHLEAAVAACSHEQPVHLLYIDLDRFKEVNDVWGHAAGDEVIQTTAERIAAVGGEERVARFGGDEFVVFINDGRDVEAMAVELLDCLRQPYDLAGANVTIAGSIGIASAPTDGRLAEDLLRRADLALGRAKELGRDCYAKFEPAMDRDSGLRRILERDLRDAIGKGEIEVHFQPLLAARTQEIVGVEALARWNHPSLGQIEPSTFIAVAEDAGLIGLLDASVLRAACHAASCWGDLTLSVNMSAMEFRKPGFADDVARILAETEFPANRLKLEITETALIANVTSVTPALDRLRAMGIRLVLDDFGTGYSSLAYLRMFRLDGVKIDRAFVEDLDSAQDGYALLASIVALGHALGLEVTAEGIETERQKSLAITAGCDQLQGYLMGHATDHSRLSQVIPAIAGPAFDTAYRQNAAIGGER